MAKFDNGVIKIMGEIDIVNLVSHLMIFMVVLLLAISAHEAGHAWMSYKFGDDTAFMSGASRLIRLLIPTRSARF